MADLPRRRVGPYRQAVDLQELRDQVLARLPATDWVNLAQMRAALGMPAQTDAGSAHIRWALRSLCQSGHAMMARRSVIPAGSQALVGVGHASHFWRRTDG